MIVPPISFQRSEGDIKSLSLLRPYFSRRDAEPAEIDPGEMNLFLLYGISTYK